MMPSLRRKRLPASQRRGAAMVLIIVLLVGFVMMAAITVDYSYIQLVRTEMRTTTDAAAKAGAEALARTESVAQARAAAIAYAALNTVGGDPLLLRDSDILVGRLNRNGNDWEFQQGASPPNAVRIEAKTGGAARHPAIPLFFGLVHGRQTIMPAHSATAGQQEVEVCLCLDRSGSMLFDMSGEEYVYPPNNPNLSSFTAWGWTWRNHLSPPHPTASRWAVLDRAIDLFLDEAGNYNPPPRTALVTWSSDYTMPISPGTVFSDATTNIALPSSAGHSWSTNKAAVQSAVNSLGANPMMGGTNLSAGLDQAVAVLQGPNSKSFANKIVILLTDGQWNAGRSPLEAAADAKAAGITVHCVTMLTADQPDVRQAAEMTGGRFYATQNETQLREAFRELARSLPIVLTH